MIYADLGMSSINLTVYENLSTLGPKNVPVPHSDPA